MKRKLFFSFALFCLGMFFIQSCSSEYTTSDDGDETSTIEIEVEDIDIAPIAVYCRYNVTYSEAAHIKVGSIVCTTCISPCKSDLDTKVKVGNNKVTVKGTRVGSACKKCPSDGTVI